MKALYLFLGGIVSVILIGLLLMNMEQGKDVLIQVGENPGPFLFSLLCVLLWAFLNWYAARIIGYAKQISDASIPAYFFKHIPRLIAVNGLVIIQAAVFSLRTLDTSLVDSDRGHFYYFHGLVALLFVIAHNLLYWLLINAWDNKNTGNKKPLYLVIGILSIGYIGWILYTYYAHRFCSDWQRHVKMLPLFALVLFGFEWLAIRFFIVRRRRIDEGAGKVPDNNRQPLSLLSIDSRFKEGEQNTWRIFGFIATLSILFFILVINNFDLSDRLGPMAVLLLALGVLIYFVNLVSYFSIRIRFNLHVLLWLWAIILGLFYDPYQVETVDIQGSHPAFAGRPSVKDHFKSWLLQRKDLLEKAEKDSFQVYIVLSNGGGSRNGNWSASLLSKLQDKTFGEDAKNSFSDHLLCLAGASGGTIGNMVFYSLLSEQQNNNAGVLRTGLYKHAYDFFSTDFLSYTLAHMLGTDIYRHIIPYLGRMERGRALELSMTSSKMDTMVGRLLNKNLEMAYDYTGRMPAFFINTTRVDNGMPSELSSVLLPDSSQRKDVNQLLDIDNSNGKKSIRSIRLVTAGVLSSRFPYVAPAGKIKDEYFVDGGYFDNSGAGIVLEYLQALEDIRKDTSDPVIAHLSPKIHLNVLQIASGLTAESKEVPAIHPLVNDLVAPILTLVGMQGSSTQIGNGLLRAYMTRLNHDHGKSFIQFNLFKSDEKEDTFPMSWVISDYNIARMAVRANEMIKSQGAEIKMK